MILHAVLARRPAGLRGRAGVEEGRRLGRRALARSARLAGATFHAEGVVPPPPPPPRDVRSAERLPDARDLPRDADGAPRSLDGWHWSTTNTRGLVGALVAPCPVALDAEWLHRPRLAEVRAAFDRDELERIGTTPLPPELVVWTAKEAVLKLARVGLAALQRCRIVEREGPQILRVTLDHRTFRVRQLVWGEHLLAFACSAVDYDVRLETLQEPAV